MCAVLLFHASTSQPYPSQAQLIRTTPINAQQPVYLGLMIEFPQHLILFIFNTGTPGSHGSEKALLTTGRCLSSSPYISLR
jgi:hypothetical protein